MLVGFLKRLTLNFHCNPFDVNNNCWIPTEVQMPSGVIQTSLILHRPVWWTEVEIKRDTHIHFFHWEINVSVSHGRIFNCSFVEFSFSFHVCEMSVRKRGGGILQGATILFSDAWWEDGFRNPYRGFPLASGSCCYTIMTRQDLCSAERGDRWRPKNQKRAWENRHTKT